MKKLLNKINVADVLIFLFSTQILLGVLYHFGYIHYKIIAFFPTVLILVILIIFMIVYKFLKKFYEKNSTDTD